VLNDDEMAVEVLETPIMIDSDESAKGGMLQFDLSLLISIFSLLAKPCLLILDSLAKTSDRTPFAKVREYLTDEWAHYHNQYEPVTFTETNLPGYFVQV
jgi:Ulp1 family protease